MAPDLVYEHTIFGGLSGIVNSRNIEDRDYVDEHPRNRSFYLAQNRFLEDCQLSFDGKVPNAMQNIWDQMNQHVGKRLKIFRRR